MADTTDNKVDLKELVKILNPQYTKHELELSNLQEQYEEALEKGSDKFANVIGAEIVKLTASLNSQMDAVQSMYDEMVRMSGGRKDFDMDILKEMVKVMVQYNKVKEKIAKNREQYESEKNKKAEDGKPSQKNIAEIQRLNDEHEFLNELLKKITTSIETNFGVRKSGEHAGEKYRGTPYAVEYLKSYVKKSDEGLEKQERIAKAMEESVQLQKDRYDRKLAIARAQKIEKQELEDARNVWNTLNAMSRQFWGDLKKAGNMWLDFNAQAISDAKRLGMTSKDQAMAYTETLIEKTQTLSRNFAMSRDEAMKMQEAYAKVTGRATLLTQEQMTDIAAASKLMGQETVMNAIQMMDKMGTTSQTAVELLDSTYARARNAGIDINKASEVFVKNLSLANKLNFRDGVDGISRMAVYSQKIRMDMQEIGNIAEHFSTIEDAIENSAKLQMLGGAGAMLGANPMEMMFEALADPEALQKRVADIFADQAIFNRATGQATIAPIQQAIIREQAKALGMNPDEAIQTAKRQAEISEIESDLMRYTPQFYNRLSESERDSIINKAQYDKETRSFYVNYRDEKGKEQRVDIKDISRLTEEEFKSIAEQVEPVEDIRDNVRRIAEELVGTRERWNSMKDQLWMGGARAMNWVMKLGDKIITGINSSQIWSGLTKSSIAIGGLWMARGVIKGALTFLAPQITKATTWASRGISRGIHGLFGKGGGGASTTTTNLLNETRFTTSTGEPIRINISEGQQGSQLSNLSNNSTNAVGRSTTALKTASRIGSALGVVAAAWQGYEKYSERNELASEKLKTSEDVIKYMESKQGQIVDTRRAYSKTEIERMRTQAKNRAAEEKAGAVGSGVGTFGGALAGGLAGAKIGGMIGTAIAPGVGTFIGGAIGGVIGGVGGAFLGDKYGKEAGRQMASTKGDDIINKHLNEINKGDVEDNFRKIVLPVESIDYNVSLIANQLGVISAKPSMGNIYLESEIEAVKRGENPVEIVDGWQPGYTHTSESGGIFYDTSVRNGIANNNEGGIGGVKVNKEEIKKQIVTEVRREMASSYDKTQNGKFELIVNGSIDLNLAGTNIGKIGPKEFQQMLNDNPQIMRELSSNVFKELVSNGTGSYKLLSETQYSNRSNIPGSSEYGSITG